MHMHHSILNIFGTFRLLSSPIHQRLFYGNGRMSSDWHLKRKRRCNASEVAKMTQLSICTISPDGISPHTIKPHDSFKIIIITLFQEDNIVGTSASLTYGPHFLLISENYLQYDQSRWGLRTPSMLRAGYPTLLAWRGWVGFIQGQYQQVTTRIRILGADESCQIVQSIMMLWKW